MCLIKRLLVLALTNGGVNPTTAAIEVIWDGHPMAASYSQAPASWCCEPISQRWSTAVEPTVSLLLDVLLQCLGWLSLERLR